jgi:4-amino-4-deoxy-L-arabinose transferase-like glycosyltransferase
MDIAEPIDAPTALVVARRDVAAPPAVREFRRDRRELWKLFAVLALLTLALRLPAFFVDVFNSDETYLATQAQVISHGGNLYEQAADRKPPLVPYVYAASFELFGTTGLWSVRVVAMLAVALTAMLLAVEARRRYGRRAAWLAGILFVVSMVAFAPQDGQAANFEVFMLPATVAAIVLARRGKGVWAGASVAVATLAKQTGVATLIPVFYLLARRGGKRSVADAGIGFALPIAVVALLVGPGQLLFWTVLGNGSYVGVKTASTYVLSKFALMTLTWAACNIPILFKLPRAWRDRRLIGRDGHSDADLWLWLISGAVMVAIGLRFFGHYYMQIVPPLCLLTAGALSRGTRRAATTVVAFAATCGLAFSAAGYFMRPFDPEPNYQTVSRYLAANTAPNDRIAVWGSVPEIYWASNRRPATRFLTTSGFLADVNPGRPGTDADPKDVDPVMWQYFYQDLAKHPPRFVIDTSPARIRGAQYAPIGEFPKLQKFMDDDYRYVRSIDKIAIYEHK